MWSNKKNLWIKVREVSSNMLRPQHVYNETSHYFNIICSSVNPNFLEEHYQKNVQLDQRLKDVFVTSMDPQVCRIDF